MSYFWIAYLAALLSHKPPVPSYPAPMIDPKVLNSVKYQTVLISVENWEGVGRGTGVLIDEKHILTCAHMIEPGEYWVYTYPKSRVFSAKPVAVDFSHDLAIFELSEPVKLQHYAAFNTTTTIGQPIVVVGNTLGSMKWFVSYGIVSEKEFFYDLTTATIRGGNSGGPWVNLAGEVVAITDWGLQDGKGREEGISGGVNAEVIQRFIYNFRHPPQVTFILGN